MCGIPLRLLLIALITIESTLGQSPLQFGDRKRGFHIDKRQGRSARVQSSQSGINEGQRLRLPTPVTPSHYALEIMPVLDTGVPAIPQFSAPGKVTITITCQQATTVITLHSSPILKISEDTVKVPRCRYACIIHKFHAQN
jgi:hypothetical protein